MSLFIVRGDDLVKVIAWPVAAFPGSMAEFLSHSIGRKRTYAPVALSTGRQIIRPGMTDDINYSVASPGG